jgi:hypothetical protein
VLFCFDLNGNVGCFGLMRSEETQTELALAEKNLSKCL